MTSKTLQAELTKAIAFYAGNASLLHIEMRIFFDLFIVGLKVIVGIMALLELRLPKASP